MMFKKMLILLISLIGSITYTQCKPVEETITVVGQRPLHANRVVAHRGVATTTPLPTTDVDTTETTLQPSVFNQDIDVSSEAQPVVENDSNYIDVNQNLRQVTAPVVPTSHRLRRVGNIRQPGAGAVHVQLNTGQATGLANNGLINIGNNVAGVTNLQQPAVQQQQQVVAINDPESRLGGNANNVQSLVTNNGDVSTNLQPLVANTNANDDGTNTQHVLATGNTVADVGKNFQAINAGVTDAANAQHVVGANVVNANGLEEVRPKILSSAVKVQQPVGGVNTANMQAIGSANRFTSRVATLGATTADDSAQDLATPVGQVNVNGAVTEQSYEICTLSPSPCNDEYAKQVCDVCQSGRQLASYKSPLVAAVNRVSGQLLNQNTGLGNGHLVSGGRVFANSTLYHEDDYGRPVMGNNAALLEDKCVENPCSCCQEVKGRNCQDVCDDDDPNLVHLLHNQHQTVLPIADSPCHQTPCECCIQSKQDNCGHVCALHGSRHVDTCHGDPCHCCHVTRQENCDLPCRSQTQHLHQHPIVVHHRRITHHHHEDCDPALDHNCGEATHFAHGTFNGPLNGHPQEIVNTPVHHGLVGHGHFVNNHHGNFTDDNYQNHNDGVDSSNFDFTGPHDGGEGEMNGESGCKCSCNCNCDSGGGMPKIPGIEHIDFIDHDREGCKCTSEECNCPAINTICKEPCRSECSKKCKCPKT